MSKKQIPIIDRVKQQSFKKGYKAGRRSCRKISHYQKEKLRKIIRLLRNF